MEHSAPRRVAPDWTWLEYVGVLLAVLGTVPFAFLALDLLFPNPSINVLPPVTPGVVVWGFVAAIGWYLLLRDVAFHGRRRTTPVPRGAGP